MEEFDKKIKKIEPKTKILNFLKLSFINLVLNTSCFIFIYSFKYKYLMLSLLLILLTQ